MLSIWKVAEKTEFARMSVSAGTMEGRIASLARSNMAPRSPTENETA